MLARGSSFKTDASTAWNLDVKPTKPYPTSTPSYPTPTPPPLPPPPSSDLPTEPAATLNEAPSLSNPSYCPNHPLTNSTAEPDVQTIPQIQSLEDAALMVRIHTQNTLLNSLGFPSLPATLTPTPSDITSTLTLITNLLTSLQTAQQLLLQTDDQMARLRNDAKYFSQKVERLNKEIGKRDHTISGLKVKVDELKHSLRSETEKVKHVESNLKKAQEQLRIKASECSGCRVKNKGAAGFGWGVACGKCIGYLLDRGKGGHDLEGQKMADGRPVYWDEVDGRYYFDDGGSQVDEVESEEAEEEDEEDSGGKCSTGL
ncbi:hypothetical protein HK097_002141 [Rhizophlyctis rosea]|uniref:Uncharacterized protein n=1 Tax=Rhizophlyctis rosea TaxID=64517 RepID=A0AAD5S5Q2_9FUNG|nr:hypothetical protein HK097_002141 [Rhizophlyctis rosea]